jgi:hypothetical protein
VRVPAGVKKPVAPIDLRAAPVFLSASIPDPERWSGRFNALAITDAVVAVTRAVLNARGILVTAAHPTIAPLVLYVARELRGPTRDEPVQVIVYQSRVYESLMPDETHRFEEEGIGELRFTPAVEGDRPIPGEQHASLALMRRTMLEQTRPAAIVVIGGMPGVAEELELFELLFPTRPSYVVATPGGVAAELECATQREIPELRDSDAYPVLSRLMVEHLATHLSARDR